MGTAISRGRIGAGTPTGTPMGTPTGTPALTGWPGDPGFPGRPGLPGTPSVPGNPCGGKKGHSSATGVPRSADPTAIIPLHTQQGCDGAARLPLTKQIWGRGWRGRNMPLGARTLCLGTPGFGDNGVTHSVPLLSWLLDALSWWSPWSYRSRGARQPVAALGQQRRQAWWQVVAEGHLSPLLWTPCTPTQDITGSPGGPGCPGRPCGDKSSDQHPLRAVTGRIWGHEAPPQLQGGTPKHLPPLQCPLYRPARGQSKGVRGCTPLPAPCVGKTRSPRCPLSPPGTGPLTLGHGTAQGFGSGSGWRDKGRTHQPGEGKP